MFVTLLAAVFAAHTANGAVLPRHECKVKNTSLPFSPMPLSTPPLSKSPISTPVEYIYITEYTTIYASQSIISQNATVQTTEPLPLTGVTSSTNALATDIYTNTSSLIRMSSVVPSVTSLLQYGPGLPGPLPSSIPSISATLPFTPSSSSSSATLASPDPRSALSFQSEWTWPTLDAPNSTSNQTSLAPTTPATISSGPIIPTFIYSPAPSSSPVEDNDNIDFVISFFHEFISQAGRISTAVQTVPFETPIPAQPTPQSSTAIVIVPVTPTAMDKRAALTDAALASDLSAIFAKGNGEMAGIPTWTIERTILTDSLPSSMSEESRTCTASQGVEETFTSTSTYTSTKIVKTSAVPSPTSHTSLASSTPLFYTSIISADVRCPYPYPDIHCGSPKTTLVTETKSDDKTTSRKPTSTGWCPYPGQIC